MTKELEPYYKKFQNQLDCISFLSSVIWNDEPTCPRCGSTKHSQVKSKSAYHCNFCNRTFTVTMQTIFHKSKIDLQKWFYAISIMLHPHENITVRELAEKMEVAKDTAWAIQKKIKSALIYSPQILFSLDNKLNEILWQTTR
jgi:transposase-like protein